MKILSGTTLVLALHVGICMPVHASGSTLEVIPIDPSTHSSTVVWQSTTAEHIYGFPDLKPHKKGTLALGPDTVTFSSKAGVTSIDRNMVTAVSAGNQRKEIWGKGGQVLRAVIPNGGGVAAAMVMHHRVDMLTLEYVDKRGAVHGAVFFLPAHQADLALQSFAPIPAPAQAEELPQLPTHTALNTVPACQNSVDARSILVAAPNWEKTDVPAAYRTLVYEHVVDRLRRTQGAGPVYRVGDSSAKTACPQYTLNISIVTYKQGSQVKRAVLGPVGFFVGTTNMTFDTTFSDASGSVALHKQIKGASRGESESTNVADGVAKSMAKQYASVLKDADKKTVAQANVVHASLR